MPTKAKARTKWNTMSEELGASLGVARIVAARGHVDMLDAIEVAGAHESLDQRPLLWTSRLALSEQALDVHVAELGCAGPGLEQLHERRVR